MLIADTHTHLNFSSFDADREEVVTRCRKAGVKLQIQIGCDELSSLSALALAQKHDDFYSTVGLHPCDVLTCFEEKKIFRCRGFEKYSLKAKNYDELFALFETLLKEHSQKIVGIGETGFDLYHNNSKEIFQAQTDVFLRHTELAKKYNKTLVIHGRNSKSQMMDFFGKNVTPGKVRGVIHCFSEDEDYGRFFTEKYGFSLGIGGVLTYPNAEKIRQAVKNIPLEFLVTETDSPFLVPQSMREKTKRNDPSLLGEVVKLIAELKKMNTEKCAEILFRNAEKLFLLP